MTGHLGVLFVVNILTFHGTLFLTFETCVWTYNNLSLHHNIFVELQHKHGMFPHLLTHICYLSILICGPFKVFVNILQGMSSVQLFQRLNVYQLRYFQAEIFNFNLILPRNDKHGQYNASSVQ